MPSLSKLIARAETTRTTVTVYAPEPSQALDRHFGGGRVTVEHVPLAAAAESRFVVVRRGEEFVGSVPLPDESDLARPAVRDPGEDRSTAFQKVFSLLDDASFLAFDRQQMLAVAREIEDRALRVADGEIHAAFQTASALDAQRPVYERLGSRETLAVTAYVGSGEDPPVIAGVDVEIVDPDALGEVWAVAFRGGDPIQTTALVGEERDAGEFAGFWTDDAELVSAVIDGMQDLDAAEE